MPDWLFCHAFLAVVYAVTVSVDCACTSLTGKVVCGLSDSEHPQVCVVHAFVAEFVHDGGGYLGFCAGAYYACERVLFEPGTVQAVVGSRELKLFRGVACGSIAPGFDYRSEAGTQAALIAFGPAIFDEHGRVAGGTQLTADDYTQAMCGMRDAATPEAQALLHKALLRRVDICGQRTCEQASARQQPASGWQECLDYVNGGPCFFLNHGAHDVEGSCRVLARYGQTNCIAAVRSEFGQGQAVLCGSHPEFDVDRLLDSCEHTHGHTVEPGSLRGSEHLQRLRALYAAFQGKQGANAEARAHFLRLLFREALPLEQVG